MTTPRVVVVGESLVDVIERDGARRSTPGGSPLNVAVGLARLGLPPYFVSEIGEDSDGALLREHLESAGVPGAGLVRTDRTSSAVATIGSSGSAEYRFDIGWRLPAIEAPPSDVIHTGSIGAWLEPGAQSVQRLLTTRTSSTLASLDLNIRPSLIADRERTEARIDDLLTTTDIGKLSDEDASWLFPGRSADEVIDRLLDRGPGLVVLTRGGDGARLATSRLRVDVAADVVPVIDTIGAGDSFMAALLVAILSSGRLDAARTRELDLDDLVEIGGFAAHCAAITVGRPGADPPTISDIGGFPWGER